MVYYAYEFVHVNIQIELVEFPTSTQNSTAWRGQLFMWNDNKVILNS